MIVLVTVCAIGIQWRLQGTIVVEAEVQRCHVIMDLAERWKSSLRYSLSWPSEWLGFSYVSWRQSIGLFIKEKMTA